MGRFLATVGAATALTVAFFIGFVIEAFKYPDQFVSRYKFPLIMIVALIIWSIVDPSIWKVQPQKRRHH